MFAWLLRLLVQLSLQFLFVVDVKLSQLLQLNLYVDFQLLKLQQQQQLWQQHPIFLLLLHLHEVYLPALSLTQLVFLFLVFLSVQLTLRHDLHRG